MNEKAGEKIGSGLAWMGFRLMIGLANFGESTVIHEVVDVVKKEYQEREELNQTEE